MTQLISQPLLQATASTFEDLGFLLPDADLTDEQREAEVDSAVCVGFRGPFSGCVEIRLSRSVLTELATNMLGEMETPSDELLMDALGEIANVVCGNVLPEIGGREAVFNLDAPRPTVSCNADSDKVVHLQLGIDEGRAEVILYSADMPPVAAVS